MTVLVAGAAAVGAGCTGVVNGAAEEQEPATVPPPGVLGTAPGAPASPGSNTSPSGGAATGCRIGPTPLRRLTRTEYDNTVRDLLGYKGSAGEGLPPDAVKEGFDTDAGIQGASPLLAGGYFKAAEKVAAGDIAALLPCPAASGTDECAKTFIDTTGKRAFRRPLRSTEQVQLVGFYQAQKGAHGFEAAVRLTLQVILSSPQFLYRLELAPAAAGQTARLSSYEVASRLSYLLWGSMPDGALFAAADANQLQTKDQAAKQAERMLADPKARPRVRDFYRQWLMTDELGEVTRDSKLYPGWSSTLPGLMATETATFAEKLTFDEGGDYAQLVAAPHSYMNKALATYLGVRAPAASAFEKVALDPARYAGIVTHAGLLAMNSKEESSHPVYRGRWVRAQLLCHVPQPPPASLMVEAPRVSPTATTRQIFAEHSRNPSCAGCHALMDPIGFGLEQFDATGRWRATDRGLPIDARGEIVGAGDASGSFVGAAELGQRLAKSTHAAACLATQMFRFGYGRTETADDECALAGVRDLFTRSGGNLKALAVAMTQTDAFLLKAGASPGGK